MTDIERFLDEHPQWREVPPDAVISSMAYAWWRLDQSLRELGRELYRSSPRWFKRLTGDRAELYEEK